MVPPGTTLPGGRYRLDSHIAAGGMGEVWRGTDELLRREVAIKLLRQEYAQDPEASTRFRAEARHAAQLSHPNIAQVFDFSDDPEAGQAYLVMELVDGPSLATLLTDGPVGPAYAMAVTAQLSAGLAAAHAAGLVHRDIKPGNLLISKDGLVKITDFGIAHAAGAAPITRTGDIVGTVAYLAPERATGTPAGPSADMYAAGMVAYECLTGKRPFTGDPLTVVMAHQERPLPPLPTDVPDEVAALVADLTAKDPAARPSSADVVTRADGLRADLADTPPLRPGLPALAGAIVGTAPQAVHRAPDGAAPPAEEAAEQEPLTRPVAGVAAGNAERGSGSDEPEPASSRGPFGWIRSRTGAGLAAAFVVLAGLAAWMLTDQRGNAAPVPARTHPVTRHTPSATVTPAAPADQGTAPAVAPEPASTPAGPSPSPTPTQTRTTPPPPTPTPPPTTSSSSPPPTAPSGASSSP